ncbi:MAG: GNAT family N-acetyltransferase [Roseiarcus sp.]
MPDFAIRPARPDDWERWLPIWLSYHAFYKNDPSDEVTRTTWARFFDPAEPMHALVAERGDRLIGATHYLYHRNTWMIAPVCYLQDLFTLPEARGRGVGRALIEAVYEKAREAGSPRVYWTTHETNAQARILYDKIAERSGFIQYRKALGT